MGSYGEPWVPGPDYTHLLRVLRRQGDPGNVPFLELFAYYARFDGPIILDDDTPATIRCRAADNTV